MRWNIGTFRHVAEIAKIAVVDDFHVISRDRHHRLPWSQIHRPDRIKWETHCKTDTASTAVTDIEYALEFGIQIFTVVKLWILPVEWMPCRGIETTFPTHVLPLV
eukprot:UN14224